MSMDSFQEKFKTGFIVVFILELDTFLKSNWLQRIQLCKTFPRRRGICYNEGKWIAGEFLPLLSTNNLDVSSLFADYFKGSYVRVGSLFKTNLFSSLLLSQEHYRLLGISVEHLYPPLQLQTLTPLRKWNKL